MDKMHSREGETEEKAVSTSGMEGTVQRLRDLRIADRKYASLTHTMQLHSRGMLACFIWKIIYRLTYEVKITLPCLQIDTR